MPPPRPSPSDALPPAGRGRADPSRPTEEENLKQRAEDLALVRAIRAGDSGGWQRLLGQYQDKLFALCVRMAPGGRRDWAEDFAQEAMVKIIQGLDSYDGRSRLSTWMFRVTMNVCLSRLRSEKYRRHASLDSPPDRAGRGSDSEGFRPDHAQDREPSAHSRVELDEERQRLLSALARIDPDQRAILLLRDSRGLDYDQIAEVLGTAIGTVKSRLFRARQALKEAMEHAGPAPDDDA